MFVDEILDVFFKIGDLLVKLIYRLNRFLMWGYSFMIFFISIPAVYKLVTENDPNNIPKKEIYNVVSHADIVSLQLFSALLLASYIVQMLFIKPFYEEIKADEKALTDE